MSDPAHAVVVLAAGGSRRLGRAKQLVEIDGETMVRRAARMALETGPAQGLIVVGAGADAVWRAVADLALTRVDCADWATGLSATIRAAVRALDAGVDAALLVLCDQPALEAAHLRKLVQLWRADPGRAVASSYAGTLGVPAVLPRSWFASLGALTGDRGARELLRDRSADVGLVPAAALARDVDLYSDLDALRRMRQQEPRQ
jgi:CTP:molybdopterin cytidylyltransferase MocA